MPAPASTALPSPTPPLPVTGNTEFTRPENRAFFPALDGLRALAFILVFYQHYYELPWGWSGVNIFFVLSGFLITGILFDSRSDPHRARNFYVRRTLRIFPLYYAVFLCLLLLWPVFHWTWSAYWLTWPLYLANFLRILPGVTIPDTPLNLAANAWLSSPLLPRSQIYLGHFWSLCVEEQFYLVWPWIVFWIRSRRALLWICGLAVVLVPLLRLVAQHVIPPSLVTSEIWHATPFQLDSLLLGGLLALLWRTPYRARLLTIGRVSAIIFAIATIAFLAHSIDPHALPSWREAYIYPTWLPTFGFSFVNLFAASLVLCCLSPTGWFVRLFSLRPLRWLGRVSYGAYIFHDFFHDLYVHVTLAMARHSSFIDDHTDGTVIVLAFSSTLLFAWLSFRFFESPFLNLKERLTLRSS